jgi:serine/threonine protein kinase
MAVSESEESLCSRIGGLKVENPPGERGDYIPRDKLDDLINHSTISSELQSEKIPFDENLLTYILKHAKLLFSIMVRTGSLEAAAKLPKLKLTDDYLPVQYAHGRVWSLKGAPMGDRPLDWFGRDVQNLTQKQHERWAGNFCSNQWIFLAPVFDDYEAVYPLQEKCPLPFTKYKGTQQRGATAFVAEAHIHPGHQKVTTQSDLVAIKNIDTEDRLLEKVVQLEVAALDFVRRLQHPHLIKFIASYSRVGRHHLMFEWADGGNLKDFWRTHHPDIPSRQQVIKWAVEQMTGLAGALDKLHNPGVAGLNCRHGDLKPANIVRTKERGSPHSLGHLQITDMGLAKVNDQLTRIRRTSGTFSTTERYQSPEFKFRRSYEVPTSRGYDIWSMGCILLELTVWLLYGGSGLDRFNHSFLGCFFAGDRGDYIELQPSVQNWISYMRNTALGDNPNQCVSKALAKLLNYIVDHLLVPDPRPPTELIEDPHFDVQITAPEGEVAVQFDRVRAKSQELLVVMEAIRNQGQRDPLYFFDDSLDSSLLTSLLTSPPTGYSRRPSASGLQVPDAERSQVRQSLHSTPWNANTQHPVSPP